MRLVWFPSRRRIFVRVTMYSTLFLVLLGVRPGSSCSDETQTGRPFSPIECSILGAAAAGVSKRGQGRKAVPQTSAHPGAFQVGQRRTCRHQGIHRPTDVGGTASTRCHPVRVGPITVARAGTSASALQSRSAKRVCRGRPPSGCPRRRPRALPAARPPALAHPSSSARSAPTAPVQVSTCTKLRSPNWITDTT